MQCWWDVVDRSLHSFSARVQLSFVARIFFVAFSCCVLAAIDLQGVSTDSHNLLVRSWKYAVRSEIRQMGPHYRYCFPCPAPNQGIQTHYSIPEITCSGCFTTRRERIGTLRSLSSATSFAGQVPECYSFYCLKKASFARGGIS
jgi:hypothetical protein